MNSDLTYWLVMAGLALVVIATTGGVAAYAYFSEERWGRPRTPAARRSGDASEEGEAPVRRDDLVSVR